METQTPDSKPLVSVVTVCLNSARTIRRTIESVLGQSYSPIEYIIIDGVSTDGTLDIIREYGNRIAVVVSEKDAGISDAFSKGIARARGEFVQLLNADDWLPADKIEKSVAVLNANPTVVYVFGDIVQHGDDGSERVVKGDSAYKRKIDLTMTRMNHPTMLVRRTAYEQYGAFHKEWKVSMDYDWILRLHKAGETGIYSPDVCVNMNLGGVSDRYRIKAFREVRKISIAHGLWAPTAWMYYALRSAKHFGLKLLKQR